MGQMIGINRDIVDILKEDQLGTDPNIYDVCGVTTGSVQQAWRQSMRKRQESLFNA